MAWKIVREPDEAFGVFDTLLYHAGIAERLGNRPDVSVAAYAAGNMFIAIDTVTGSADTALTPQQARELAALLLEAADVADRKDEAQS